MYLSNVKPLLPDFGATNEFYYVKNHNNLDNRHVIRAMVVDRFSSHYDLDVVVVKGYKVTDHFVVRSDFSIIG